MTPKGTVNLARLRQWIEDYISLPTTDVTWSGLFRGANISPGTENKIKNHDKHPNYVPEIKTVLILADAMGRDRFEALVIAGYIEDNGEDAIRTHSDYDLSFDEVALVEAYRHLKTRDVSSSTAYAQMALDVVKRMSTAGGSK